MREWWKEKAGPLGTLLLASLIIGSSIGFAARAHADPESVESYAFRNATAVCAMLSNDDSDAGISAVINLLVARGVTYYQAGEVVGLAVFNVCPAYQDRVLDWAHAVTAPVSPVYQAGQVGGAIL